MDKTSFMKGIRPVSATKYKGKITGRFIITNIYYREIVGRVFTKPVQIEGTNKKITETGCLYKQKSSGRPLSSEDNVERFRASVMRSPNISARTVSKELSMSKTTLWRVLRKRLV